MINQVMGLLLPSVIGNIKCTNMFGEPKEKRIYLERYFILVLVTNLISYAISIWLFKQPGFEFTNQFTVKYLLLSTIISYLLPVVGKFIKTNLNLNLVVKKNEK